MSADPLQVPDGWTACPFYCGTQASEWEDSNCFDCQHGDRGQNEDEVGYEWGRCKIRDAITCARLGEWDPTVNVAMGYDGGIYPPVVCASREEAAA